MQQIDMTSVDELTRIIENRKQEAPKCYCRERSTSIAAALPKNHQGSPYHVVEERCNLGLVLPEVGQVSPARSARRYRACRASSAGCVMKPIRREQPAFSGRRRDIHRSVITTNGTVPPCHRASGKQPCMRQRKDDGGGERKQGRHGDEVGAQYCCTCKVEGGAALETNRRKHAVQLRCQQCKHHQNKRCRSTSVVRYGTGQDHQRPLMGTTSLALVNSSSRVTNLPAYGRRLTGGWWAA